MKSDRGKAYDLNFGPSHVPMQVEFSHVYTCITHKRKERRREREREALGVVQLVEHSPSMQEALGSTPSEERTRCGGHTPTVQSSEMEEGGPNIQGHPQLHSEVQAWTMCSLSVWESGVDNHAFTLCWNKT